MYLPLFVFFIFRIAMMTGKFVIRLEEYVTQIAKW